MDSCKFGSMESQWSCDVMLMNLIFFCTLLKSSIRLGTRFWTCQDYLVCKCESKRLTWDEASTATQLGNTGDKDGRSKNMEKSHGHNKVSSQNDSNPDPNIASSTVVMAPDSGAENTTKSEKKGGAAGKQHVQVGLSKLSVECTSSTHTHVHTIVRM